MIIPLTHLMFFLQPGCKYLIQLRAEGNDHIERALPQHRAIEVGSSLLQVCLVQMFSIFGF